MSSNFGNGNGPGGVSRRPLGAMPHHSEEPTPPRGHHIGSFTEEETPPHGTHVSSVAPPPALGNTGNLAPGSVPNFSNTGNLAPGSVPGYGGPQHTPPHGYGGPQHTPPHGAGGLPAHLTGSFNAGHLQGGAHTGQFNTGQFQATPNAAQQQRLQQAQALTGSFAPPSGLPAHMTGSFDANALQAGAQQAGGLPAHMTGAFDVNALRAGATPTQQVKGPVRGPTTGAHSAITGPNLKAPVVVEDDMRFTYGVWGAVFGAVIGVALGFVNIALEETDIAGGSKQLIVMATGFTIIMGAICASMPVTIRNFLVSMGLMDH